MRSRTDPDRFSRCADCWLPHAYCLCALVPRLEPPVEIVIVRHHYEAWRSSGTARLTALAIPGVRTIEYGLSAPRADAELAALLSGSSASTRLLFPDGAASTLLGEPAPRRLIVPDGTWRETRRMVHRLPSLWDLPRLALPPVPGSPLRLRRAPAAHSRSTIEAIADGLALLGDAPTAAALRELFGEFVERGLRARGTRGYHPPGGG